MAEEKLLFDKHLINKLSYEDFGTNIKRKYLDSIIFNWSTHGVDILAKFLPLTTKLVNE
jgi:hypothetical protein